MSRLIIAIVVGIVIAVGAVAVTENLLNTASNGTPTSQPLYNYGQRVRLHRDHEHQPRRADPPGLLELGR